MALAEYGNAFNIDTDANGDPILIDAQSGQTVATYDRTQSAWVYGDIISDSVNTDSATVTNDVNAGSVSTERIGNGRLYAGAFDGADSDARLDNCLSAASESDLIHLEKAAYSATRTISQQIGFIGQGIRYDAATRLAGDWTLQNGEMYISRLRLQNTTLTVQDNDCMLTQLRGGDVVFESGTGDGVIDSCVGVTVTDNGTNTVGDIS